MLKALKNITRVLIRHVKQRPYLRHSLYWFGFAAVVMFCFFLSGCASVNQAQAVNPLNEEFWLHDCVPNAARDAWTYEIRTGLGSRIMISNVIPGVGHAQAQGQRKDGSWFYLTTHASSGDRARPWKKHFPPEPFMSMSLDDFISEQRKIKRIR